MAILAYHTQGVILGCAEYSFKRATPLSGACMINLFDLSPDAVVLAEAESASTCVDLGYT